MSMGIEISPTRTWLAKHDQALANAAHGTPVEQLQKLKEALAAGFISQDEHDERRRKIVDEMTGTQIAGGGGPPRRRHHAAGATTAAANNGHNGNAARGGDGSSRTRKQVDRAERDAQQAAADAAGNNGVVAVGNREEKTQKREDVAAAAAAAGAPAAPNGGVAAKKLAPSKREKKDKYAIARPPPDWGPIPHENALLHIFDLPSKTWSTARVTIKIDRHPFAKGSLRFAHFMTGLQEVPGLGASESTYVAKISIDPFEERDSYFQDVMMQMLAKEYARKYNSYNPPKKVHFIKAWLIELIDRPVKPLVGVERFITGQYRKHNNNFGYVSEDERNTPQAFSHFTYEGSNRQTLICDIQGVGDMYTDPQIHSFDGNGFGKGNMGERGFNKFLATHRCNPICRYLKLPIINANNLKADDDSGTMPSEQYMSYTKVEVIKLEFKASYDPSKFIQTTAPQLSHAIDSDSDGSASVPTRRAPRPAAGTTTASPSQATAIAPPMGPNQPLLAKKGQPDNASSCCCTIL